MDSRRPIALLLVRVRVRVSGHVASCNDVATRYFLLCFLFIFNTLGKSDRHFFSFIREFIRNLQGNNNKIGKYSYLNWYSLGS